MTQDNDPCHHPQLSVRAPGPPPSTRSPSAKLVLAPSASRHAVSTSIVRDRQHRPLTVVFPFFITAHFIAPPPGRPLSSFRSVCSIPVCTSVGPCFPGSCAFAFGSWCTCNSRLSFPLPAPVGSILFSHFMDSFLVSYITCMAGYHVPQSDSRFGSDLPPSATRSLSSRRLVTTSSASGSDTAGKPQVTSVSRRSALRLPPGTQPYRAQLALYIMGSQHGHTAVLIIWGIQISVILS
jgi:hypothetical protein